MLFGLNFFKKFWPFYSNYIMIAILIVLYICNKIFDEYSFNKYIKKRSNIIMKESVDSISITIQNYNIAGIVYDIDNRYTIPKWFEYLNWIITVFVIPISFFVFGFMTGENVKENGLLDLIEKFIYIDVGILGLSFIIFYFYNYSNIYDRKLLTLYKRSLLYFVEGK